MHVIDVGETALVEGLRVAPRERGKGVAGLLGHFYSQSVKRQHPGVKVALLTRDNQLGPQELKKYRLIAKQSSSVGGARLAALRASGIFSPLPTGAVSEAGSDMACLLMSPSVQRDDREGTGRYLYIDAFGSDGAQVQSQLLWHLQSQAPRLVRLNVCARSCWRLSCCRSWLTSARSPDSPASTVF
ncbi:putative N-acetyltransferase 16 [Camelus dromedarius]|uniref:Putative N-acetyltransferase 16 n=1 Tax=Camelus dromedarius TaxID=9838 RepID=A0A5N4CWL5_CAMDR|nr:putative N-acetyltransferase 16 [Camelus dromedarius]